LELNVCVIIKVTIFNLES